MGHFQFIAALAAKSLAAAEREPRDRLCVVRLGALIYETLLLAQLDQV